ncbi:MAG: UDP-N-acetylmuramoyl-tripeptide--D-alanyl-D-alanine ligase [Bacteroidales bacterium]|nr:UDP-N-acetylmuramoyl-tripeptide--D-alanyl-D-alanine ligase [Bacteroidales bacterium]
MFGMNITELYKVFLKYPAISTDTRREVAGSLFFSLKGETFNGNVFAREAIDKGAAFAVVDEGDFPGDLRFIRVENCLVTLQQLAQYHRERLNATLIAITGSNGKTTTKELVREILAKKYKVYATEGNMNNHIGVPLSLLRIDEDVQFGIIEMGANHIGEIEKLCHITRPDYGIITNIGRAHIEGFGSVDGVKKAKGELYDYLSEDKGGIFINTDNTILIQMAEGFEGKLIKYGDTPDSLCRGSVKGLHPYISFGIAFHTEPGKEYSGSSRLVGSYNLENILAAACIGSYFNVSSREILDAVEEYIPGMMRSQLITTGKNLLVVDTYNANPSSMEPAIQDFAADPHPNKILVLGEMKELGDTEIAEHEKLIRTVAGKPFRKIIFIGPVFLKLTVPGDYLTFKSTSECIDWLKKHPVENAKVLLKGSRLLKLEELINYL